MRYKKLFTSALLITTSLFLFTGCGEKAEPVSAESTETINEVDTEETIESTEPSPSPAIEPTEETVKESSESEEDIINEEEIQSEETEADYVIESIEPMSLWAATNCNLRSGPGTQYDIVGSLSYAQEITVDGKVEKDGKQWFVLQSDTEEKQMVSGSLVVYQKPQPQQSSGGSSSTGTSGNNNTQTQTPPPAESQQPSSNDNDEGAVAGDPAPGGGVYQDAGSMDWSGDSDWVWH
jgi:uncharacterized protein YgiM (DUF1202 family)